MASRGLTVLLALTSAALVFGCAPDDPRRAIRLDHGTLRYPAESRSEPITLPEYWAPDRREARGEATYDLPFRLSQPPTDLWAIYLPRVSMNAAVYVNGHFVGDGGRLEPPVSRNANRPLLFSIPTGMLRAGENSIQVRLVTIPTFPGLLDPPIVGPDAEVQPAFVWRSLVQVTALQAVAVTSIAVGLLILGIFARRDEQGANTWFAFCLFLWAVALTEGLVRNPPMPARLWEWSGAAALAAIPYCLVRAFHLRIFDHRLVTRERGLLVLLGLPGIVTALVPARYAFACRIGWQVVTGAVAVYVVVLIVKATRRGLIRNPRLLLVAALVAALLVAHDLLSILWARPISGLWLTPYAASVTLLFSGWTILANLADSLTEAERLNEELEGRVQEKHQELEANYQRLRALERESAIAAERERIMQDVHDGIGGQLVSTLALVESGRGESAVVADSLHEALDDLRLIIDSLDPEEGDLAATLGTMRLRLQPRLERGGIEIDWQVRDVPPLRNFGAEQALQVLRIVQEAIANVLKHADAHRVRIQTGIVGPNPTTEAYVEIADDGRGMGEKLRPGRGLANMRRRASVVGGRLEMESGERGTRVRLLLPLAEAAPS